MLAQLCDVTFGYAGDTLLEQVTWQVNTGDHVGLIGPNGSGKSTMLRLLAGEIDPESGRAVRASRLTIGYLRQSQELSGEGSVLAALLAPFAGLIRTSEELVTLSSRLAGASGEELERYGRLEEEYRRLGGYSLNSRVRELATGLGFRETDLERAVGTLSGGERNRLELAKVLLSSPDLLLLDEPTNHLDSSSCERLERFLASYAGAFVLVSHDRALLGAVANKLVELNGCQLDEYAGGWEAYLEERERRHERARAQYQRQQEEIGRTEDFIRRNIAGQKSTQAKSRRKMLDRIERLERPGDDWEQAGHLGLTFSIGEHQGGKEVLVAEKLSVGFKAEAPLLSGLDLAVYRGDRLGVVGPNGCGKSTLLRTLVGLMPPLAGTCRQGYKVRVSFFDQSLGSLDEKRTLIEEIRSIRGDMSIDAARAFLARFRFFGDDAFRAVAGLSGGERNRLCLAKMILRPANVLALDEPTNHLDIPTREILEEALSVYEGTTIIVSHDRFFLDQLCTRLFVLDGGMVHQETGNYSDWKQRQIDQLTARRSAAGATATTVGAPAVQPKESALAYARERAKKAERNRLERRLAGLEEEISGLESQLASVKDQLANDDGKDWQSLHALAERERELDEQIQKRMADWEMLGSRLLAIQDLCTVSPHAESRLSTQDD
ncbi:MAG: ABC-F family ATP-binding cassette domain-containing protein [Pseudomonadota bacterium]